MITLMDCATGIDASPKIVRSKPKVALHVHRAK